MKSTWILILMVMLTVQSLGLSYAAPAYQSKNAVMAMESDSADAPMPCHSSDEKLELADCCAEQDCSCCWGCAGLLSTVFGLGNARYSADSLMIEATRHALSGNPTSLYRPPIFA